MRMRRREVLRAGSAAAVSAMLPACAPEGPLPPERFHWGVASGDPTTSSVVLWTRLAVTEPEELVCEVFTDPALRVRVADERVLAEPARDGCAKLDLEGLSPDTTYYFRFSVAGSVSPIGRTRTLPLEEPGRVRVAFVTCSNYAYGFFHGYRRIAERADLALVVHLGDTMYEYADGAYGALRPLDPPHETVSLDDYRRRHACYRRDPDLGEMLRQHPLVAIWDDHEFANNAHLAGALAHDEATQGPWRARVAAARAAFFEWMPCRDETRVHRSLELGALAQLVLLDTRMEGREGPPRDAADRERPDRRLVSQAQERWLIEALGRSDVRFTVLGNQVVLAPCPPLANQDAWDGFPAQQARLLEAVAGAPSTPVVMTGDTHGSLAFDLPGPDYDAATQAGSVGVEWGSPALASPHFVGADSRAREEELLAGTPHLRFTEQEAKGYVLLDLTPERARCEWWLVEDATRPEGDRERLARAFECTPGDRASRAASEEPSAALADAPPLAP